MRNKFWYVVAFILICLGVLKLFEIISNMSVDKNDYKYMLEQEYNKAKNIYVLGREWGEVNAQYVVDNDLRVDNVDELAVKYFNNPEETIICVYSPGNEGDEDCMEFPDLNEINILYNVYEYKTTNFPLYAFKSGFIDGFKLYIEEHN